jgi:SAM-dependent methyltransferase
MSRVAFIPYPPTAFPFRDLLVLERLPLSADDRVCEIGVGSGGTTARLAKICGEVVGFDISAPTVQALRYLEDLHPNLRLVVADVTQPAALAPYAGHFTRLIACDTLEHVRDPGAFFVGAASLLERGGHLLVTFRNEPKYEMHGVTRFDEPREIEALLAAAGFSEYRVGAANLSGKTKRIADTFSLRPSALAPKYLRRKLENDGTRQRLAPALNAYWFGVLRLMESRGPAFDIDWTFEDTQFTGCQVLVLARR